LDLAGQRGRRRIEVQREFELVQRLLVQATIQQAAPGRGVVGGRAEPRRLQSLAIADVVGMLLDGLRVLEDGAVEVLPALRARAGAVGGGGRAAGQGEGEEEVKTRHPAITSTPRGTSNRKRRSSSPTFSRMSSNANWLRLPWASSTRMARMRSPASTSTYSCSISGSGFRGVSRRRCRAAGPVSRGTSKGPTVSAGPERSMAGRSRASEVSRRITCRSAGT